tara:strand:- start:420 stop:572 length:153 start_codon:yes stop_codon:yes gene_type:complete
VKTERKRREENDRRRKRREESERGRKRREESKDDSSKIIYTLLTNPGLRM